MKNLFLHRHISFTLLFIGSVLLLFQPCSAGNYTWTGSASQDWALDSNWNPIRVPSGTDTATIVTTTNSPRLSGNATVGKFTMTSGTLDCSGHTLSISAAATFNGGSIISGTVTCYGTSTLNFCRHYLWRCCQCNGKQHSIKWLPI